VDRLASTRLTSILFARPCGGTAITSWVYRFFRDQLQARYLQFIPIVERREETSIRQSGMERAPGWRSRIRPARQDDHGSFGEPDQYGRFLVEIFDAWVKRDVGRVFVQSFDAALANGSASQRCIFSRLGQRAGDEHMAILRLRHYVEPDYLLAISVKRRWPTLVASPRQRKFGRRQV